MWAGVSALLAVLGGWSSLATHFRSASHIDGQRFRFVSGSMGLSLLAVSYARCLFLTMSERGFEISVLFVFRLLSPPLFIPWRAVESVESKRFLLSRYTVVRLHDQWPAISVRGAAGERLRETYLRMKNANAP
jgi:hypothetical protein